MVGNRFIHFPLQSFPQMASLLSHAACDSTWDDWCSDRNVHVNNSDTTSVCLSVCVKEHATYQLQMQGAAKTSRHINLRAHFYICRPVCCLLQYVNSVWVENLNISAVSVMESYQNKLNKYSWKIRQMRTWRFQSWLFLHVFFSPTH